MRKWISHFTASVVLAASFATVRAADDNQQGPPQGPPPGLMGMGGPRGPGGPGGMGRGVFGRDALQQVVSTLGDLNLSPGFELSADQKTKIQAIRDDFKKQQDQWRTDHDADLKLIQDEAASLRQSQQPDPQAWQDLQAARQQLMASAPKGDDAAAKVKAVLTDDQQKQLADKVAAADTERKKMMEAFGGPGGPGGRGGPGGFAGGPPGGPGGQP